MVATTAVGAIHAIYPWNEPKRVVKKEHIRQCYGEDTKEQIKMCLSCTRSFCNNCITSDKKRKYGQRTTQSERSARIRSGIASGHNNGNSINEICKSLGISRSAYYYFFNQIKEQGA